MKTLREVMETLRREHDSWYWVTLYTDYGDHVLMPPGERGPKNRHIWDLSSNHPEMKCCVICGEKDVAIEAGDGVDRGFYRGVCCGDHAGNATSWFAMRQNALDSWNSNKAPIEMCRPPTERIEVACRDCGSRSWREIDKQPQAEPLKEKAFKGPMPAHEWAGGS